MITRLKPALWVVVAGLAFAAFAAEDAKPNKWEGAIEAFERQDAENPPPKHANLFVGSSSILFWKLEESFPDYSIVKRGFGGSQMADSTYYADRIVIPHEPDVVVVYAGDNDIDAGKTPEEVFADYQGFVSKVHEALPETKIVYIAIKPSVKRWALWDKMQQANTLIREEADRHDYLAFVDIAPLMMGEDGTPRADLLLKDGLHLNDEGYTIWADAMRPLLKPGK